MVKAHQGDDAQEKSEITVLHSDDKTTDVATEQGRVFPARHKNVLEALQGRNEEPV